MYQTDAPAQGVSRPDQHRYRPGYRTVVLVGLAVVCLFTAACSNSGDGGTAPDDALALPPLGDDFDCTDPIDVVDALPPSHGSVGAVVAFEISAELLDRGRIGPDNDSGSRRAFSKTAMLVRPGSTFQIHVAPKSQSNALMQWGNAGSDDPVGSLGFATGLITRCSVGVWRRLGMS